LFPNKEETIHYSIHFFCRWGFTPLEEAKRFQHDLVFRYLAKYVEDHYPKELEQIIKEQEEMKKGKEENPKN
jgi:hypothetical protein